MSPRTTTTTAAAAQQCFILLSWHCECGSVDAVRAVCWRQVTLGLQGVQHSFAVSVLLHCVPVRRLDNSCEVTDGLCPRDACDLCGEVVKRLTVASSSRSNTEGAFLAAQSCVCVLEMFFEFNCAMLFVLMECNCEIRLMTWHSGRELILSPLHSALVAPVLAST